jgi:hypothetical protein
LDGFTADPVDVLDPVELEELEELEDLVDDDEVEELEELEDELVEAVMLNMLDWAYPAVGSHQRCGDTLQEPKGQGTYEDRVGLVDGLDKVDLESGTGGPSAAIGRAAVVCE